MWCRVREERPTGNRPRGPITSARMPTPPRGRVDIPWRIIVPSIAVVVVLAGGGLAWKKGWLKMPASI